MRKITNITDRNNHTAPQVVYVREGTRYRAIAPGKHIIIEDWIIDNPIYKSSLTTSNDPADWTSKIALLSEPYGEKGGILPAKAEVVEEVIEEVIEEVTKEVIEEVTKEVIEEIPEPAEIEIEENTTEEPEEAAFDDDIDLDSMLAIRTKAEFKKELERVGLDKLYDDTKTLKAMKDELKSLLS